MQFKFVGAQFCWLILNIFKKRSEFKMSLSLILCKLCQTHTCWWKLFVCSKLLQLLSRWHLINKMKESFMRWEQPCDVFSHCDKITWMMASRVTYMLIQTHDLRECPVFSTLPQILNLHRRICTLWEPPTLNQAVANQKRPQQLQHPLVPAPPSDNVPPTR
jgi:hypothetical protein